MGKTIIIITFVLLFSQIQCLGCQSCYKQMEDKNCDHDNSNISSHMMHMTVHPHLDAFWIFDFQSYYNPDPTQGQVRSYFASNRFNSVKQIFDTALQVLTKSKTFRETQGSATQKAHRSFFNSQMGFFKRWYSQLPNEKKTMVKNLINTKYWEIVGGGFVQHDQGCAYYDDIIQNFQAGLHFLKDQLGYYPRAAISADSFGHSQSTLAILAHLGIEGFFVQRSDQHILLKNKTEFVWKAKSANGKYYGALPTHIRWAIHGFEDQFIGGSPQQNFCQTKQPYISNLNRQNQFLKRILKSNHIMRYYGHDFQRFDDYSYSVIQAFMQRFSMQKCRKVNAVYGNPTEYFLIMMGEVFNKVKPLATREEDIMPIWDYDSGLYWTGYYTTDPYHKKIYRDAGKYLYAARKAFTPLYLLDSNSTGHKQSYNLLQQFSETVSYLQHHDGITGTSKYEVMDKYEKRVFDQVHSLWKSIFNEMFQVQFPPNTNNNIFNCSLQSQCEIPKSASGDVYLKVFKTGENKQPIIVHLQDNQHYQPDCQYEIICMCTAYPCPCDLYLYPNLGTYSLIKLKKVQSRPKDAFLLRKILDFQNQFSYNKTHFTITHDQNQYNIGYKRLNADPTPRSYKHLSRFGDEVPRTFSIRSGKYALGNNLKTQVSLSEIKRVLKLQSDLITKYVVLWNRQKMKTVVTIDKNKRNQWKIQTFSSAETGKLEDLYLEIGAPHIQNNNKFYTDSNGWLVMKRELFKHEDYQAHFSPEGYDDVDGNSYPMTAFTYIMNQDGTSKLSVNTQRPQGVISIRPGTIWINYDRLSSDDGKWVYENTYRAEYQKFTHYITVSNNNNNERIIQKMIDQPLIIQGNSVDPNQRVAVSDYILTDTKRQWEEKVGINRVKFQIKPWNDSSVLLRVFNMWDDKNVTIELFSADNISTFLTAFYGNDIEFKDVYETNMGGNIKYKDFLQKKWNWNSVVNLDQENEIFNKKFGETINLRPLQIRTFVFDGVQLRSQECKQLNKLKYNGNSQTFRLDTSKQPPSRTKKDKQNQIRAAQYLKNGDFCTKKSPVSDSSFKFTPEIEQLTDIVAQYHRLPFSKAYLELSSRPTQPASQLPSTQNQQQSRMNNQFDPRPPQPQQPQPQLPLPQLPPPHPKPEWIPLKPENAKKTENNDKDIMAKVSSRAILTGKQKQQYFSSLVKKIKEQMATKAASA